MCDNEIEIIRQLQEENVMMKQDIEELKARIKELEKLIAFYDNAHTPPSLRRGFCGGANGKNHEKSGGGKPGQKKGHRGVTRPRSEPEKEVDATLDKCPHCDTKLETPFKIE